jgi:hypothetical protein
MRRLLPKLSAVGLVGALSSAPLRAQPPAAKPPIVAADALVPAVPADVASVDAIMAAVYDVISGPAGQPRDWNRFRSLFAPGARLIPTGRRAPGVGLIRPWTVEEYITNAAPQLERDGFFERELGRKTERYGNIVHLMSAYDSRRTPADPAPFSRGVNSFQLWFDGTRWFVVSIFWESEGPGTPIPADLLRGIR